MQKAGHHEPDEAKDAPSSPRGAGGLIRKQLISGAGVVPAAAVVFFTWLYATQLFSLWNCRPMTSLTASPLRRIG